TLSPPLGTGEKYDAVQRYSLAQGGEAGTAVVRAETEVKSPPKVAADGIPLWQLLPEGELVYELKAGRLLKATLKTDKELKDHQGRGSSYGFQSRCKLEYAGARYQGGKAEPPGGGSRGGAPPRQHSGPLVAGPGAGGLFGRGGALRLGARGG